MDGGFSRNIFLHFTKIKDMFIACIYKDFSHFTFKSNINKNNLIFQMSMDTSIFCVTLYCLKKYILYNIICF